ncbi:hypothetical protein EDB81DRAFT_680092 [Dactylonectria macrodidyma]|uniref:DUF7580 domain-containing protein n=1 Tax=Dactylonectria macrodidyma TaxID=307937 RepID=A0A9P9JFB5_9HYPO|nr:hypothetical protein EDB81DRAFT_680092 [Dactylonectria macrodidyma]
MSGIEAVGIVLGTIPLLVTALEAYCGFMRDWGKAHSELRSLNRQLTTEQAKLYNVCNQLISDVVPQRDIEPMLKDPFGPLWQIEETNAKIRRRLWSSYSPFEETVVEVKEVLDSVMQRLSVQVTRDGQATWVHQGQMTREFKKLLYRLNRKDYKDSLDTISKCISDLEGFARLSITLQPGRQKLSRGKLFKVLRDLASSIWRALHSSISCNDSHHISLELATRLIDIGHDGEDEKILRDAQFKVAISFEVNDGAASRRFWDEVNIKTALLSPEAPETPPIVKNSKLKKGVSFSLNSRLSFMSPAKPLPLVKSALAIITEPATNIAYIKTTQNHTPLNLCMAVKSSREARPVCYGHLIDSGCTNRHFQVCPLGFIANSEEWSIISLHDVLGGKNGLQPLISLVAKVRLALSIASSVLQLSKTPWLPEVLTSKNVHFFRRGSSLSYEHPFLIQSLPGDPRESPETRTTTPEASCTLMNNPTLFALGILLLEIISGANLDNLRGSDDKVIGDDASNITRDFIAAHKLLERRGGIIDPVYKAVVVRCIECTEVKGLDDDDFRQKVYDSVVMELETLLDHMKLSV